MSDQPEANEEITQIEETAEQPEAFQDIVTPARMTRVFKTGATRIVEDASMQGMTVDQVKAMLKGTYPEIANATVRETPNADGQMVIEFLPQPGRKG